ncbi:hypothetical protein AKJ09_10997 [Labilithrix luteola]|uniref:Uncharacterized protein n=1 Tax=Labilithrix luteola TaxID=1391654 RepID=A0A0K1QEZ1_9BACT|nr:hypothetical protein AKJ09_10997 [Labilithrix luteola]
MDCVERSIMIKNRDAATRTQRRAWRRLQKVPPEQKTGPAATLGDRLFIEAVLFRAKTGMRMARSS